MSATAILMSALTGTLTAGRRLTPGLVKLRAALSVCANASSDSAMRSASVVPGRNAPGMRMPSCGWRARAKASTPTSCFAQIDLRLIPEIDPAVAQRLFESNVAGRRRRMAPQVLQYFQDGPGLERLLQHRQHLQAVLLAY